MNNFTLIGENIRLSFKLFASGIYINPKGEILITAPILPEGTKIPKLSVEWLETVCMRYTLATRGQVYTLPDIITETANISYEAANHIYDRIAENLDKITLIEYGKR